MGKNGRHKLTSKSSNGRKQPKTLTRPASISKSTPKPQSKPHKQIFHTQPTIPFSPDENILLIGEGDLSFARCLIEHHTCTNLIATVFETSRKELEEKYPHVGENITVIEDAGQVVKYGIDATKMKPWTIGGKRGEGMMERIFFNFPHVGGKSTDVNRQVRYNQALLVEFFKHAIPSLSPKAGSSIIVTLFEGEPYTLWNIRDLGRHSGLEVKESFKFQAKAYPGYRHARTLGVVKSKIGEVGGGWKGEERPARSYVFVRKGEGAVVGSGKKGKEDSSDDEDEEDLAESGSDEWEGIEDGTDPDEHENESTEETHG